MKKIRKEGESLEEMLKELKIGDCPILDSATGYEITRVVGGFIYKNEYIGMTFVPDFKEEKVITKLEPKKKVEK